MSNRSAKRRAKRAAFCQRRADRCYIDFETRSPFDPANIKPDELIAVYYSDGDMIKRISYDRSQFDELYAINPQLATYASMTVGEHAQAASKFDLPSWHDGLERSPTGRVLDEYWASDYSRPHVEIMGGDMLSGGVHTSTDPKKVEQIKTDLVEIERRLVAWWIDRWHEEMARAIYGVNRPEKKYAGLLDTGRNPAKAKTEKENK